MKEFYVGIFEVKVFSECEYLFDEIISEDEICFFFL